jgi:inner membrane protein
MKFFTHLAFGFLVGLFAIDFFHVGNQLLFMFFVLIASILADIDHPDSKLGKNVKFIGWIFTHRGFFHSLLAMGLFAAIVHFVFHNEFLTIAVLVGYASHLVIDAINHQGIAFFFPFKMKLKGFCQSGGFVEYLLLFAFIALGLFKLGLF